MCCQQVFLLPGAFPNRARFPFRQGGELLGMEIGRPERQYEIEPLEEPVPREKPNERPAPEREPARPAREPVPS
jgi:hypothetical protein